ncbi:hypothetical protein UY3_17891 [Chelonia mydas]|uniref:Uncharacterized protein n=1 Tax=Chelonia mydas TaxID=8469 RepID=M7AZ07_CHEMY|nr:hypothetical protein UY3_17891 [Chelonia mydas]
MITGAMLLFSAFMGTSSTLLIATPENPVHAITNQTAVLPISLRFSTPPGEFFHLKWDFLSGDRPVLAYVLSRESVSTDIKACEEPRYYGSGDHSWVTGKRRLLTEDPALRAAA